MKPSAVPGALPCDHAASRDNVLAIHGCAQLAVALISILDSLFALLAAQHIKVYVGPLVAIFAQETLEEQVHADRINRGYLQHTTDYGVRGAAASLNENAVALAVTDEVQTMRK